jgi:hypothetical protein
VEYAGRLIAKERKGWHRARELAGLPEDVTPHVLKLTCITWLLQNGVQTTGCRVRRHVGGDYRDDLRPSFTGSPERSANRILRAKLGQRNMKGRTILAKSLKQMVVCAVKCEPVSAKIP